jgi:hypothetical protein
LAGHNDPSCFISRAGFHPAPTPEFVWVDPGFGNLGRESPNCHHSAPAMLIVLHPFVNIISNHAPIFHSNTYEIPELLFVGGLAPIRLGFASCQNIGDCRQSLFKLLIFVPFVKFSIMTQIQSSGFSWSAYPYTCVHMKSPICCEI